MSMWHKAGLAVALVGLMAIPAVDAGSEQLLSQEAIVETDAGPVRGIVAEDHRLFQGIPYAAPPIGEWRWQSPQPVAPWTEVRDAMEPGNFCVQGISFGTSPAASP